MEKGLEAIMADFDMVLQNLYEKKKNHKERRVIGQKSKVFGKERNMDIIRKRS